MSTQPQQPKKRPKDQGRRRKAVGRLLSALDRLLIAARQAEQARKELLGSADEEVPCGK